uniref:C-CAP/cofactor C-like domain-containing protein n=1 Tax=Timema cristinae TaxID=61476 RepID=A0A7R9H3E0_TIMCR|nr:unnamed protein product [Timema cristinae]
MDCDKQYHTSHRSEARAHTSGLRECANNPSVLMNTRGESLEYQTGVPDLMIDNVDMSDIVYMFKCQSTNLVIKGKLNSVILDSCCNSSIVFDSILTGIEFINCQSVHMQPRTAGNLETDDPVAAINSCYHQTTGRLPLSCLGTELSRRSTNISEEARHLAPEEYPVPEQFKTTIGIMGLVTVALEHGH